MHTARQLGACSHTTPKCPKFPHGQTKVRKGVGGGGGGKRRGYKKKIVNGKWKRIASVKKITWNIQILYCMYVFISFHIHLYPVLDRTAYRIHIQYTGHRYLALNI